MNQQNKDSNTSKQNFWMEEIEPMFIEDGWKIIEPTEESFLMTRPSSSLSRPSELQKCTTESTERTQKD